MELARKLAEYTVALSFGDLDPASIQAARQRIVDSLGCALGAINAAPVQAIASYTDTRPEGPAHILFSDRRVDVEAAAFLNATMVRFLDFNDGYFALEPGHSSDNIPACLAVGQAEGSGGQDILLAIAIAYEVQMRLQDVSCLFRRGWDHVNFVTISATMAVGKLLKLTTDQLVHALGMSLNGHIAMRQVRSGALSGWKGASAANATRNAIFCCYLARHGMTGPAQIFDGEMGFFAQVSGQFDLDVDNFGNGQTHDFHIKRALTKLYPTNGEMQTAVQAAVALRKQIQDLSQVATVTVETTDVGYKFLAKDRAKWRPDTRETADHSLPYTVARALIDGTITRATYDEADFKDPVVLDLIDRITVREDPKLAAQMPSLGNRVTICLNDGKTLSAEFGTVESPRLELADEEIERKFREFAQGRIGAEQMQSIFANAWRFDKLTTIDAFMASLALPGSMPDPRN